MTYKQRGWRIGIALLVLAGLGACDKPGPAELAGANIDQAAEKTADKMSDMADKAGDKMHESANKAGMALDDTELTARVKTAIYAEPGLRTLRISVDTKQGVVTLTGSVDSQSEFDRVKELAEAVAGVREVANRLQVKPAG